MNKATIQFITAGSFILILLVLYIIQSVGLLNYELSYCQDFLNTNEKAGIKEANTYLPAYYCCIPLINASLDCHLIEGYDRPSIPERFKYVF